MAKLRIVCASDLHGTLPKLPDGDLLLLGGDYCPKRRRDQHWWFRGEFKPWLEEHDKRFTIVGVAGNHDWYFVDKPNYYNLPWTYLQDAWTEFRGLKIYGAPWQLRFFDWAFNLDEPELEKKWALIPDDADVLLLHGPPLGVGDEGVRGHPLGSPSLRARIEEIKPKLVVFGHIHEGYGQYQIGETLCVNASHMDERYRPVNPIQVIELEI
jgi:Icc-related predicted phosphoesterase